MQIITGTITLSGTTALLSSISGAPDKCAKISIEPGPANAAVAYVGAPTMAIGTSTVDKVIKQLAKPSAVDAILDNFRLEDMGNNNTLFPSSLGVAGASSEKVKVTFFVN